MLGKASENPRNFFLLGKATRTKSSYETNILLDKASTQQILVRKSTHELYFARQSYYARKIHAQKQSFGRQS